METPIRGPVTAADRFESLDALRGLAVLGILMVNVQAFTMIWEAYQYPPAHMDISGANLSAWFVTHVFFELKFITIFSALFGAGVLLMAGDGDDQDRVRLHRRRMTWLLVFGLLHAYLLWYGDILTVYAVAGFIIVLFRRMSPSKFIVWGLVWTVLTGLLLGLATFALSLAPDSMDAAALGMAPTPEALAERVAAYQSGWLDSRVSNALQALIGQLSSFTLFAGRVIGVMFLGMALFKLGFFTAQWSARSYVIAAVIGLGLGLPPIWLAANHAAQAGFPLDGLWIHTSTNYFASLLVSLGYASLVMLACKTPALKLLRAPFAAAGRMAFTNYLTQTLIMVFISVGGVGLGLYGEIERAQQVQLVLAIWVVQLIWSPIWLRFFRYGPFEWLWRSLTYGGLQAIRR
jgi:uncharacterized protein